MHSTEERSMTVKTAISLQSSLLARIDEAATRLNMSRSRFMARAAEELVRKLENETLLAQINDAYADHPDAQEQEEQQRMWQLQRRRLGAETW
jgi:metal-responsive CopG/Arc/MetJ family transcriptional regulator